MNPSWKDLDLNGGGVQTVNLLYIKLQRSQRRAVLCWLGFPLGLHRVYLKHPRTALLYALATSAWLLGVFGASMPWWSVLLELPFALYDLLWIERAVTDYNKALRLRLYSGMRAQPPPGHRGRVFDRDDLLADYVALKDTEQAGIGGRDAEGSTGLHVPSIAEQEALLRQLGKPDKKT